MKEEPPKFRLSTPTKSVSKIAATIGSDEILSTLLKLNNFDSISSIKDESLDIDLSACVTIHTDPLGTICGGGNGGNSMSSDFWRVLDENAQNVTEIEERNTPTEQISFQAKFICPVPPPPPISSSSPSWDIQKKTIKGERRKKILSPDGISRKKTNTKAQKLKLLDIGVDNSIKISGNNLFTSNHQLQSCEDTVQEQIPHIKTEFDVDSTELELTIALTRFKCLECEVALNNSKELAWHEAASHKISFQCVECDKEFENENTLKKHIKTHRTLEARKGVWKKCPDCGKCLKLGSMWMHRKIHTENKKYSCDICGQKFVQKINLTHHSRVHSQEKPFECPECQKRFQERSHLQRHQKYHAQTRSYRCDKCGKMYKTERCLKVHNLVHLEQRPFACNVCEKSFISNSKLKQHSNIHTGERPFKCNYCPRDFTNFPNWLKHTRRRHKVDHKTGEQLENIPSYCSKKTNVTLPSLSPNTIAKDPSSKPATKRQKKVKPVNDAKLLVSVEPPPLIKLKTKRIRKEISSKIIKKEPLGDFPDLHCLSITSAEEFIMEQALEMEECGLYDAQDAQQENIQVKPEPTDIKVEFDIKHSGICSLESSPFSSPASIEYSSIGYIPSFSTSIPIHSKKSTLTSVSSTYSLSSQLPQAVTNHLYLPIPMKTSMTKPLPNLSGNQALPSVNTLLFNTSYFVNNS